MICGTEEDSNKEEKNQLNCACNTVDTVVSHSLEDFPTHNHSCDNDRKTRFSKDDISCIACRIGRSLHSNSNFSFLQCRGVVDTITSHTYNLPTFLQNFNNFILVLRKNLREAIRCKNHILSVILAFSWICFLRFRRISHSINTMNRRSHTKSSCSLNSNSRMISSNHLYLHPHVLRFNNGSFSVGSWRVKEGKNSCKLESSFIVINCCCNTQCTVASISKVINGIKCFLLNTVPIIAQLQNLRRSTLCHLEFAFFMVSDGRFSTLD
mmetsp:Transcript_11720/g.18791  ORF Transcript_11720/g.18791 Transcript_11720/m.18791 type:complete len:267 (-) Transcript_11720:1413-2213(-)